MSTFDRRTPENDEFRKQLGTKIKEARTSKGMSQIDLAERFDMTHQNISGYESGKRSISVQLLIALCCTLDKPMIYFIPDLR